MIPPSESLVITQDCMEAESWKYFFQSCMPLNNINKILKAKIFQDFSANKQMI